MSTDSCRGLRRGPTRVPLFFQKHGFHWSTMCAQSRRVSVYLSAFAFLSDVFTVFCLAFVLFLRLGRGICWQFSSCTVPPVFPFFSPCLPCLFVLFYFPHFFSFFLFCLYSEFILVEDVCGPFASFVDFPFFFWRVSSGGGFSPLFSFLHWVPVCQNVFLNPLVGLDIPCTIGKDGGFIRRDRSFHLPRINLARAGRCVTDTLSKRFMSVGVSTG